MWLAVLVREFMKSHSRTKESYLLLLRTSNHFERSSADFLCIGWIEPPSMRQIFEVLCIFFFSENCSVVLKFNSNISAFDLSMSTVFLVLKSDEFRCCSRWCMISGCFTLIFRYFLLNMGLAWGLMVCELFYHVRVTLCLRVNNRLVIMSADPITSWIACYVLFSHGFSV